MAKAKKWVIALLVGLGIGVAVYVAGVFVSLFEGEGEFFGWVLFTGPMWGTIAALVGAIWYSQKSRPWYKRLFGRE